MNLIHYIMISRLQSGSHELDPLHNDLGLQLSLSQPQESKNLLVYIPSLRGLINSGKNVNLS
jgi:hypothetical protein